MKIRINFRAILKELETALTKELVEELKKKVRKAAGMKDLTSTAKREYVVMELASADVGASLPRHLVNLAIEAVVAAEKATEVV